LAHMVGSRASGWPALCRADPGSVPIPAATAYRVFTPYGGARPGNELAPARIRRNISLGAGDWRSGSAAALHAVGRGFESLIAHHFDRYLPAAGRVCQIEA